MELTTTSVPCPDLLEFMSLVNYDSHDSQKPTRYSLITPRRSFNDSSGSEHWPTNEFHSVMNILSMCIDKVVIESFE